MELIGNLLDPFNNHQSILVICCKQRFEEVYTPLSLMVCFLAGFQWLLEAFRLS